VEKALLGLELDPAPLRQQRPSPTKPVSPENSRQVAAEEDQSMSLSQSWEDVRVPESLVPKSTPLRDVQFPRLGGSTPAAIFPVRLHGSASSTTPRKNPPGVATVPSSSARPVTQQQPLSLFSGVGSRTAFGTPNAIASPASGIKLPSSTNFKSSYGPSPSFMSASRQRNAFYQPPVKSNGVKRAFEDESRRSPDHDDDVSSDSESPQADVEVEPERGEGYGDKTTTHQARGALSIEESDEDKSLQYSVFGAKKESSKRNMEVSKKKLGKHGHGSHGMDDEDEDTEIYEREQKKPTKTRNGRTTRATQQKAAATAPLSKPPAKKAKQIKDVVRHIPGGLMEEDDDDDDDDEEDHEDQVTALPTTRIPRNSSRAGIAKGKRKAPSVDNTDEMEVGGIQTRRRSSRLTAAGSSGRISPEPVVVVAPKTRRAGGRTSTASKKKR